jgi:hypothetical protein
MAKLTHLYRIIHRLVPDVPPLPVVRLGNRVLIKEETFEDWLRLMGDREIEAKRVMGYAVTAPRNMQAGR